MKRALALLEQTKNTMPHLPRPTSKDEQDYSKRDLEEQMPKKEKRLPSANRIVKNDKSLMNGNVTTEISSRKSTAVSSTTRIGSSGNPAKRSSITQVLAAPLSDSQPLYELSIKNHKKQKPYKLKPLTTAKAQATSLLDIENAYEKQMMKEIESDINDYLDPNQIFSQMQTAFGGGSSVIPVAKSSASFSSKSKRTKSELEPIIEENGQMMPYMPNATIAEQRAKKNELLKKQVKKLTGDNTKNTESKNDESETFMTACHTKPPANEDEQLLREYDELVQKDPSFGKPKKYYKYPEDELLDEVNQHERDMNDMLKYLTEVEDLIHGQDLQSIQQMMDVTKETMNQHFQAYDKFKDQIVQINNQADQAIQLLTYYESDNDKKKKPATTSLTKVDEEDYGEKRQSKDKASQEQQKHQIVDTLMNMNEDMRGFSREMETRLDKIYKAGASKKFGYDSITNLSENEGKREDRDLNKMQSKAQQFIEQNSASALLKAGLGVQKKPTYKVIENEMIQRKPTAKKNANNNDINNML